MKSKPCICKEDFRMDNTNVAWNIPFIKGTTYNYSFKTDNKTKEKIYFVSEINVDTLNGVPFVEKKFNEIFDITQQVREKKINHILND